MKFELRKVIAFSGLLYILILCEYFYFTSLIDETQHNLRRMLDSEFPRWSHNNHRQPHNTKIRREIGWKATAPTAPEHEQTKILIIFPYRNREIHYHEFIEHFASIKRPEWDVSFMVIDQGNDFDFRRAWLLNIGIAEALKLYEHKKYSTCLVGHDIDMLASSQVDYSWCDRPTQTCSELSCEDYSVPYPSYTGGTVAALLSDWESINGLTNVARGWGGEDDELYQRFRLNNLLEKDGFIRRAPKGQGVCECLNDGDHTRRKRNNNILNDIAEKVFRMQEGSDEWKRDGLNNLKYKVMDRRVDDYNTLWLKVDETEEEHSKMKEKRSPDEKIKIYKILNGRSIYAGIRERRQIF